jgi:hypothetical protein
MSLPEDRVELAALAHRRYPDMELPLAVRCLLSDRRHAGLGALDERRRLGRNGVNNYKHGLLESGQVRYHLVRRTPPRMDYPLVSWADFAAHSIDHAEPTIALVKIPARNQHLCVPADWRELTEQSGRRSVAAALRKARRMLRNGEGAFPPSGRGLGQPPAPTPDFPGVLPDPLLGLPPPCPEHR